MIGHRKVIAIVAGRGGSKGLPGKNVATCGGRPLVAWSVEAAKRSRYVDRTIVTSDDPAILEAARAAGAEVPFTRPAELSTDEAKMADVVMHALDAVPGHDVGVLLQATSPLRVAEDVDAALELLDRTGAKSVTSVTESAKSPWWMFTLGDGGRLDPLFPEREATQRRRQELPKAYALNGAVYAFDVEWFRVARRFVDEGTVAYVMPPERSVDVDTAFDLELADFLRSRRAG
jgi:CMP-N,N'-diacetyllegionaminic acid synthase